jgi:hypothetical protein
MTTKDPIRVALEYMQHKPLCSVVGGYDHGCTCGRDEAAKALESLSQPAVDEREMFENELRRRWPNIALGRLASAPHRYALEQVDFSWQMWQARASLSRPADVRRAVIEECAAACDARADDHDNGVFNNFRVKKRDEARACAAAIRALAQKEAGNG